MGSFAKLIRDQAGVTGTEVGLIIGLIAIMVVTVITTLGERIGPGF